MLFTFFNEIGILAQLSRALFEARLPLGFTVPQFSVLNNLVRVRDGRSPGELARAFQVPKTSMTHSLAVLERHGLVEMRPNARDGRSKYVFITEAGRDFRQAAIEGLAPDMAATYTNGTMVIKMAFNGIPQTGTTARLSNAL